jgi:hypothetical protein
MPRFPKTTRCFSAIIVVCILWPLHVLSAQTLFEWPSVNQWDVSQYESAEACLALTNRMRDSVDTHSMVWRDTISLSLDEITRPLATVIVERARVCSSSLPPTRATIANWVDLIRLYLVANRDTDVQTVVSWRLTHPSPLSLHDRLAVLDTVAHVYLDARPVRIRAADTLITMIAQSGRTLPWQTRSSLYAALQEAKLSVGDTAGAKEATRLLLALPDTWNAAEKDSVGVGGKVALWFLDLETLQSELLDSLRQSNTAYLALLHHEWAHLTGVPWMSNILPMGAHAAALQGEFWFPASAHGTHPAPGKVSLVVFLSGNPAHGWTSDPIAYAALRRIGHRFPTLDITIASQTEGWFGPIDPPSPAQEAALIHERLSTVQQLPGTLVVSRTPFWRLPAPDGRRVDSTAANVKHYMFGRSGLGGVQSGAAFLVDRDGTLILAMLLSRDTEQQFMHAISALLNRSRP